MTREEFEELRCKTQKNTIYISELNNLEDRTLIYGYTLDRSTFHLYIKDMSFRLFIYDFHGNTIKVIKSAQWLEVSECLPSKRAYPESCDFEFCNLVAKHGGEIPFTNFSVCDRGQFAGELCSEDIKS